MLRLLLALSIIAAAPLAGQNPHGKPARARELGVAPGVFPTGKLNTITDVAGVRVGQTTIVRGDSVRTGVTAILPHPGNIFLDRVPAAIHVGNGFGKLLGVTQVTELGEIETPILLTCTLCVWKAADALVGWMLEQPGMEDVRSINPVVGETNDGTLNAIRSRPIDAEAVRHALTSASARRTLRVSIKATCGGRSGRRSASTAAAPPAMACGTKASPSVLVPATATNRSPGRTLRLSDASPLSSSAAKRGSNFAFSRGSSASFIALYLNWSSRAPPTGRLASPFALPRRGGRSAYRVSVALARIS